MFVITLIDYFAFVSIICIFFVSILSGDVLFSLLACVCMEKSLTDSASCLTNLLSVISKPGQQSNHFDHKMFQQTLRLSSTCKPTGRITQTIQ